MSFNPLAVFVYGPDLEANSYLDYMDNQAYIASMYIGEEYPITVIPTAVDCSSGDSWPDILVGNAPGQARFYIDNATDLRDYNTPILAENRLVTAGLELWAMNGDQVAGCEPISTMSYTPTYTEHWSSHSAFCAIESNDYRLIRDNFHAADHKSYLDFYRLHDGAESALVSAFRGFVYDPMFIPPIQTRFGGYIGYYSFTYRSQHVLSAGETAYFEFQYSKDVSFSGGTGWYTIYTSTDLATLVQHWSDTPSPGQYVYDYHQHTYTIGIDDHVQTWYFRVRRVDKVGDTVSHTSDWSGVWTLSPSSRSDMVIFDNSPSMTPYYCYRDYDAASSYNGWTAGVVGYQGSQEQGADVARLQIASDEGFTSLLYNATGDIEFDANGYSSGTHDIVVKGISVPRGSTYYARCRYETSGGGTVGEWSNVFTLASGDSTYVNQSNWYGSPYTNVLEEHYYGDRVEWNIASEPLYISGHTYVLLCKSRLRYDGAVAAVRYGSLYLADYDGSAVATTLIEGEVQGWWPSGWPYHYDIVAFDGKLYAGWSEPSDSDTNLYDWCEITGGTVGTIHHVARPAESPIWSNWATMAVIHGDLRVVAGLDTDDNSGAGEFAYILGIANILSADPAMKAYPDIKAGYTFTKDPWLHSIWFDYQNYAGTESGVCWLASLEIVHSFLYAGKFQPARVTA